MCDMIKVMTVNTKSKQTSQNMQDAIFRKMSADKKLALGAAFWRFAKEVSPRHGIHKTRRSAAPARTRR